MQKIMKINLSLALAFAVLALTIPALAEYPERTITYLLEHPPGGGTDRTHRAFAPFFSKALGGKVALVNKPGSGGAISNNALATAKPDGYTMGTVNLPHSVIHMIQKDVSFTPDSFTMLGTVNFDPTSIAVRIDSPIKTLEDLIKAGKEAKGNFIIGGIASSAHGINITMIARKAGVDFKLVNLGGGGPSRAALLGGHVKAIAIGLSPIIKHQDKLRILVQTSKKRTDIAPNIPTAAELGYEVVGGVYRPIAVPKGTSAPIVQKLRTAFEKAMKDPELHKAAKKGKVPLTYIGGPETEKIMKDLYVKYKKLHEEIPELKKLIKKK
jgi:tripartite-type tricarboxylate transporter receptor subunit TctC